MMRKTFFNFKWIFFQGLFLLLIILGIVSWDTHELWVGLTAILIGAFLMLGYALVIPYRYRFDADGITVCYCFGIHTSIKWSEIKHIHITYDHVFPWRKEYRIGYFKTRFLFHSEAVIVKNRKTAAQINENWHKEFEIWL